MIAVQTLGRVCLSRALAALSLLLGAGLGGSALAQALRDPTIAPPGIAGSTPSGAAVAGKNDNKVMSVMVVDGLPFVMAGSRLYAPGDKLDGATVERISETQIWLREGKELRKISLYSGVQRQPHATQESELHCGMGKAALPSGPGVAGSDNGAKKSGRALSPAAQTQDPACKSAKP